MNINKIREALEYARMRWDTHDGQLLEIDLIDEALTELDAAPMVLTDEPVAWMSDDGEPISAKRHEDMEHAEHPLLVHYSTPLYFAPAAGLTVEEIMYEYSAAQTITAFADNVIEERANVFRARLTAALNAKQTTP